MKNNKNTMFKTLRNRFLVINGIAVSIVIIIAFFAVFIFTWNNVSHRIDGQLRDTLTMQQHQNPKPSKPEKKEEPFTPPSISFWISLDSSYQIEEIHNPIFQNITDETASDLLQKALTSNKRTFSFNNGTWAYQVTPQNDGYAIAFVDVTNQFAIFKTLILVLGIVLFCSSIVVFLLAKFFADKAIMPIKESFDQQSQFIADASHELKTPLTIIRTSVDLISSNQDSLVSSQNDWLKRISSESNRMSDLTSQLLFLTSVSSMDEEFSPVNLSERTYELSLRMESIFFESQRLLETNIEPDLWILGNSNEIEQVIIIALDNACKYSLPNSTITMNLKQSGKEIELSISNKSNNIDTDNLNHIFDRFYQQNSARNTNGYGLGLSIAKKIMDSHHAKIYASSSNNTFTLHLIFKAHS